MSKSLSNIIVVATTEISATSIDSYFRQIALVHEFDDTYLNTGQTFAVAGYEEYETIDDVAVKFPSGSTVYKWAADAFAQKVGSGVNGSTFEKLIVIQKKSTDATYLAALNRVAYVNAYWIVPLTNTVSEVGSVNSWVKTKYMQLMTQDDSSQLLDANDDTDIASVLMDASETRASVWYHDDTTEGLAASIAAILASANPGDKAAFYKTPSGITVDTITTDGLTALDAKNANYLTTLVGTAGTFNSENLTFNGTLANGDKIQKRLQQDRIILTLQTAALDVLLLDIPYDNSGGAILERALRGELQSFQTQEIIKDQVFADRNGNNVNGFNVKVLSTEDTAILYPDAYAAQKFVVMIDYLLALTGELVSINVQYSV